MHQFKTHTRFRRVFLVKSMTKIFYFIIVLFCTSCLTRKNIDFKSIENVTYKSENNSPVIQFDLKIHNPNNWGLRITDVSTNVSVENKLIGSTLLPKTIKIAGNSDILIPMQLNLSMADLLTFLPQGLSLFTGNKTTVNTAVDGRITLKKFIFRKRLEINLKQEIDLNR
jgi:LEA14-like dessication related protein